MRALFLILGLVVAAAGVAVGVVSFFRPGEIVFGLNLGLAGTLLVGGLIILALAELIGAVARVANTFENELVQAATDQSAQEVPSVAATTGAVSTSVDPCSTTRMSTSTARD